MRRLALTLIVLLAPAAAAQQVTRILTEGIYRFDESPGARGEALPSFSFADPSQREGGVEHTGGVPVRPVFSTDDDGRHVATIKIDPGTSLYGTGEVPGQLLRNGRTNITWNTDSYGYNESNASLYQSHPWVLAVRPDGTAFGVLADTSARCLIDLTENIRFAAEGKPFPVIVFEAPTPQGVLRKLADMTGTITMPPEWALGYNQCRYSYYPDSRVREIAHTFREKDIPCDVIWLDIDYMDNFKIFTFNSEFFPDPKALNEDLAAMGFHNVWMIDPGVADKPGYFVRDQLLENDLAVKTADGEVYHGDVWPGSCVFPDFLMKDTRQWWAGLYKDFMALGVSGIWNDMNEPAVFNVKSKTMPIDNVHRADADLGGTGPHLWYHNVYGMNMVKATREGVMAANPDKRPFVLSRANFIGGHRYAATWSGDNVASWEQLEWSIPMVLNLSLSGQPFNGPDIGGFVGNGPDDQQGILFARWMGIGSMLPFCRGHTGKDNIDKEPWAFGPSVEATCRRALSRRYHLLPYIYTLFHEASDSGLPVARPTFFADPTDPALRSEDDSFLLGAGLLVVSDPTPKLERAPVMPKGIWAPLNLDTVIKGDSTDRNLPHLFVRGGSIIPAGPVEPYVGAKPLKTLTLYIALDENHQASGVLYEDDGDGWGYRDGEYRLTRFTAIGDNAGLVRVTSEIIGGDWTTPDRDVSINLIKPDGSVRTMTVKAGSMVHMPEE